MLKECLHCSLLMKTLHDIITPPDSIQNHRENPHIPPSWEVFGGCLSRHLPDTLQTPHRHPILLIVLGHFLAIPRPLGEKEAANKNESNGMFMNCLHIIPPQTLFKVTKTTPDTSLPLFRHPTHSPKYGIFYQTKATGRKGYS